MMNKKDLIDFENTIAETFNAISAPIHLYSNNENG